MMPIFLIGIGGHGENESHTVLPHSSVNTWFPLSHCCGPELVEIIHSTNVDCVPPVHRPRARLRTSGMSSAAVASYPMELGTVWGGMLIGTVASELAARTETSILAHPGEGWRH